MAKSNLLKEAIADAKAVRETAIANAKLALEEAFTPKLQSMLSRKIEEEAELEDDEELEEQTDSSQIGNGDNKVDVADGDDEEKSETSKAGNLGSEDSNNTVVKEGDDEEELEEDEEEEELAVEGEEEEEDLDLEAIIRELEGEDEEEVVEDEDLETEPVADETEEGYSEEEETVEEDEEELEAPVEEDEEELDLEEIIRSLREEDEDEEVAETEEDEEPMVPESRLREAYKTIQSLKGTINEVNLLNAKLLFSNKLFKSHNLTEGQKMKIIETFDRAVSTREVKLVYSTLAESLSSGASKKRSLKEGFASKATRSTKPSRKVIVEADQFTNRMKKLAGL